MYEMIVASGTPQRRGGWREEQGGEGKGNREGERGRRGGREEEGRNCGGSREEDEIRRGGGRDDNEGRRTGGGGKDENGRRGKDEGGRRGVREETEGRRGVAREEDRRTTGRKEQKGVSREEELVRKMEECGLGPMGAVRRLEVRGGRALFTPQVFTSHFLGPQTRLIFLRFVSENQSSSKSFICYLPNSNIHNFLLHRFPSFFNVHLGRSETLQPDETDLVFPSVSH